MALTRPRFSQLDTGITRFSDPITTVNDKSTLANVDIGFVFNRDGGATSNVAVIWDETNDQFALALTTDSGATNANVTISDYANIKVGSAVIDDNIIMLPGSTIGTSNANNFVKFSEISSTYSGVNLTLGSYQGAHVLLDMNGGDLNGATFSVRSGATTIDSSTELFKIDGTGTTVDSNLNVSGNLDITDGDSIFVHGDTGYRNKRYVLYGTTTDATTTEIFVGSTSNSRVSVPTNNTVFYTVDIVARRTDVTGESAGWQLKGVADNFSGTTADVGTVYEVAVARDDTNWAVDCLADDTEDAIIVTVTGAAGKTIKWMAVVKTMEVAN